MRRKVIAGNWKMNMLPNEAIDYIQAFEPLVKDAEAEVILCVPYTDLFYCFISDIKSFPTFWNFFVSYNFAFCICFKFFTNSCINW